MLGRFIPHLPPSAPEVGAFSAYIDKSPAQVAIRFLLQQGIIIIPKSMHPEHMKTSIGVFDFELMAKEMKAIRALDEDRSLFGWW
ncbi:MAG: hypothetical protein HDQ87_11430 [Clostridia bacterium]|nr:hypothetical protein [Clostridia bacterium]